MSWIYILLAAVCEMVWPLGFKYTSGFKEHSWAVGATFCVMLVSFWLMSRAIAEGMHIGTAYAIWTGVGAAGTAILGIILFDEPRDFARLACIGLIIAGAVGLKLFTSGQPSPVDAAKPAEAR
jgi:quaternary ammonium compound-resistance protein SugE